MMLRVLSVALLVCAAVGGVASAPLRAPPSTESFEASTLRPTSGDTWTADEWLLDFTRADANGTVRAQLLSADWTELVHPSRDPQSLRTDVASRLPGLESIYFVHHTSAMPEWWTYSLPTNTTRVLLPLPNMPLETSCLTYDDAISQFYAVAAVQVGKSNVYTVTVFTLVPDIYAPNQAVTSFNISRNGVPAGNEPRLMQCAFNDQLRQLSIHFPGSTAANGAQTSTGTLMTFNLNVGLDWRTRAVLVSQLAWPAAPRGPPSTTLVTEVTGLSSTRSLDGSLSRRSCASRSSSRPRATASRRWAGWIL